MICLLTRRFIGDGCFMATILPVAGYRAGLYLSTLPFFPQPIFRRIWIQASQCQLIATQCVRIAA